MGWEKCLLSHLTSVTHRAWAVHSSIHSKRLQRCDYCSARFQMATQSDLKTFKCSLIAGARHVSTHSPEIFTWCFNTQSHPHPGPCRILGRENHEILSSSGTTVMCRNASNKLSSWMWIQQRNSCTQAEVLALAQTSGHLCVDGWNKSYNKI